MTTDIMNISGVSCYEQDGIAYLRLDDVARGLGFTQTKNGLEYIRWETIDKYLRDLGFSQQVGKDSYIPENIFYRLAMKAKNETAEKFQALVADEIIPSIRKNGGYIAGQENMTDAEILANAVLLAQKTIAARDERIAALTSQNTLLSEKNEELAPKGEYYDRLVDNNSLMSLMDSAKVLEIKPKTFINYLIADKFLYRRSVRGPLLPYEAKNKGYFEVKDRTSTKTGWAGAQTLTTVKGREKFMKMRDNGYFD